MKGLRACDGDRPLDHHLWVIWKRKGCLCLHYAIKIAILRLNFSLDGGRLLPRKSDTIFLWFSTLLHLFLMRWNISTLFLPFTIANSKNFMKLLKIKDENMLLDYLFVLIYIHFLLLWVLTRGTIFWKHFLWGFN